LRVARAQPLGANQTWAADFIHDSWFNGRRFRAFAVFGEWSRESALALANTLERIATIVLLSESTVVRTTLLKSSQNSLSGNFAPSR